MQPLGERFGLRGTLVLLGGLVVGCAHAKLPPAAPADPELSRLRAQLAEREHTIRDLESRLALATALPPHADDAEGAEPAGACRTADEGEGRDERHARVREPATETARDEPRPLLRLHAQSTPEGSRAWSAPPAYERLKVVPLPPDGGAPSSEAAAADLYMRAIDLVRRREFPEALRELDAFLQSFGEDPRALRALFWRGEVLFAQREYASALESYESALARAPSGDKAADTLLRIARCCLRLGAAERARATLAQLEAEFPDSEAARLVKQGSQEDG